MASLAYTVAFYKAFLGLLDLETASNESFKVMLVTSAYSPNKDSHKTRSDVTNEVVASGYTAGGTDAILGVTEDDVNHRVEVALGAANWNPATIVARGAVYYQNTGAAGTDILVAYIDFGADITSTGALFALAASTLRLSNP